jgi:hypothetical protein
MSTTITPNAFIIDVADRAASREVDALFDFHAVGTLIVTNAIGYDAARDLLVASFVERGLTASTAKTYLSQGYAIAQMFGTFDEVEAFADDEVRGTRSLKAIYTAIRNAAKGEVEAEGGEAEAEAVTEATTALVDVVLAGLANLRNAGDIARVRDAAIAMLQVKAA